jgi:hypothetical protein
MPRLKRILLFAAELSLLLFGIVLAFTLAVYLDSPKGQLSAVAFFGTLLASVLAFVLFRRKSRKWKIAFDAEIFLEDRNFRRLYPRRAKLARQLRRSSMWFPSLIAALAVVFLPAMSHLVFSSRHLVPHYKFSVPLNWGILKSRGPYPFVWVFFSNEGSARYGLTPIWFSHSFPCGATFGISDPSNYNEWYRRRRKPQTATFP